MDLGLWIQTDAKMSKNYKFTLEEMDVLTDWIFF
jgi:hypothetical protein